MSRFNIILTVTSKELMDLVRYWRTLAAMLLVPLILFPIIFVAVPMFLQGEAEELGEYSVSVQLVIEEGQDNPNEFMSLLNSTSVIVHYSNTNFEQNKSLSDHDTLRDDASLSIRNGEFDAILLLREGDGNASENWEYVIFSDSTDELSREARTRLLNQIDIWEDGIINSTLSENQLERDDVYDPVTWDGTVEAADIATSGEQAAFTFALFVPFIISLWTATSAVQPSIDLTAGERERGTLEALLTTPIARSDLMWGKWLAVAIIASASVLLQLVGLFVAIRFLAAGILTPPTVSMVGWILFVLTILLFAIFVVAVEMAVAMRARSVKEAGSTLGPMVILFIGPALFAQFVNMENIEAWWFIAPIFNICLGMRASLLGDVSIIHAILWMSSSLLYALVATGWASKQFNREDLVESIS
ncbi:MAG: ABC transporter permease subunit [Candidatus Thermoplasmatota archaeon]|nr:ABC transporter permease subunit [Candidatus Thermoplasmatota archaeon]